MKLSASSKWITRRSEIQGYTDAVFCTDQKGEYVRLDYNLKQKCARLTVEDGRERCFHSKIESGTIKREWASRGDLFPKDISRFFRSKSARYSAIPDRKIVSLIRGCYGIEFRPPAAKKKKAQFQTKLVILGLLLLITALVVVALATIL